MLLVQWMTRGRTATLLWAMFALLGLSACRADVTVRAAVDDDGSGLVQATTVLDAEAAQALLDLDLDSTGLPLGDLSQAGWIVTPPEADAAGNTVIRAEKEFGNPEQFKEVMAELSGPDGVFRDFTLSRTKRFARVDYAVTGTLDTTRGFGAFADPELETALGSSVADIANGYGASPGDVGVNLDVVLPGEVQNVSDPGVFRPEGTATTASWQVTLSDADVTPVSLSSATRQVVPRVLRGVAVVTGVMAVVLAFARLLRIILPDRRGRRHPPRRPVSDVRPAPQPGPATTGQVPVIPPGTGYKWVAVDAMGVLFRETDDLGHMLVPFARQHGSTRSEAEIESRLRWLRLGRITTAEFWPAIGVVGDPEALDAAYLAAHQLSPGVIRYLRNLREKGVRLACIADDTVTWTSRLRSSHSLETLIEVWVISGSIGVMKPDRSIFEVLRRFTQDPPGTILIIDDDLDILDAARAQGFATAWFYADAHRRDARDHAIIRSFEIPDDDLVDSDRS